MYNSVISTCENLTHSKRSKRKNDFSLIFLFPHFTLIHLLNKQKEKQEDN